MPIFSVKSISDKVHQNVQHHGPKRYNQSQTSIQIVFIPESNQIYLPIEIYFYLTPTYQIKDIPVKISAKPSTFFMMR